MHGIYALYREAPSVRLARAMERRVNDGRMSPIEEAGRAERAQHVRHGSAVVTCS